MSQEKIKALRIDDDFWDDIKTDSSLTSNNILKTESYANRSNLPYGNIDTENSVKKSINMGSKAPNKKIFTVLRKNVVKSSKTTVHTMRNSPKKNNEKKKTKQEKLIEKFNIQNKAKGEKLQMAMERNQKIKIEDELRECTFTPKINKKSNEIATNALKNNPNSFYKRNLNWLHSIKGKQARLKQIKEISRCEYSYKPSIILNPKIEELFNNKDTLSYWIKNNQLYLNRHLNNNNNKTKPTKKFHTKNNSMIIHKKNSVNNSMSDTKKTSSLNRSLDMLHYELQNTAIDDESNDERHYE